MRNSCQQLDKEGSISHELLGVSRRSRYQKVGHDLYNKKSQEKNFRQNLPYIFLVNYPNNNFLLQARVARLQVLRLFWCPRDLSYIYIYLSALEDNHAVYTRCIGRMHSLATTSGPARKMGVVPIFKMADLEQTAQSF